MTTMTKISTGNKTSTVHGPGYGQTINQYAFVTDKPYFSVGNGSISKSMTRHMTESQANEYKKILP